MAKFAAIKHIIMYEHKIPRALDCGFAVTMGVIGGKWKLCLINSINNGYRRPSQLQRTHFTATRRVLNQQLKELEEHGIIKKVIYPELPPKVEYYLTEFGESLIPVIKIIEQWGENHMEIFAEFNAKQAV